MKIQIGICALLLCANVLGQPTHQQGQATRCRSIDFGSGWFFNQAISGDAAATSLDHSSWQPVQLPHTWNATDVQYDGKRGYYRGEGWYRKKFTLTDTTGVYYLHFEGVNQTCSVFVNNILCGTHVGGYTAFTIPISPAANLGENIVAVQLQRGPNHSHHLPVAKLPLLPHT